MAHPIAQRLSLPEPTPFRLWKALSRAGCQTWEQAAGMHSATIYRLKGVGRGTVNELQRELNSIGLSFHDWPEPPPPRKCRHCGADHP